MTTAYKSAASDAQAAPLMTLMPEAVDETPHRGRFRLTGEGCVSERCAKGIEHAFAASLGTTARTRQLPRLGAMPPGLSPACTQPPRCECQAPTGTAGIFTRWSTPRVGFGPPPPPRRASETRRNLDVVRGRWGLDEARRVASGSWEGARPRVPTLSGGLLDIGPLFVDSRLSLAAPS